MPVEDALEALLAAAAAALAFFGGSVAVLRRRRTRLARSLDAARADKAAASAHLAAASAAFAALRREVKDEGAAAAAAERVRLFEALLPLEQELRLLLNDAPPEHVLTPGLQLVARQLSGLIEAWQPREGDDVSTDDG